MTNRKLLIFLIIPLLAAFYSCNPQKRLAKKKHTYMESAYKAFKGEMPEAEVTILNDTVKVLFPEHLLFQRNSSEINKDVYPLMQRFANALNLHFRTSILINGYTDNTGTEELNKNLSSQRADSASTILKFYKVSGERMLQWGMGPSNPIADNSTEEGRRKNRRVEFIMLYSYDPDKK
ncbi:MAG: OmpA family protein [Taibaiella sp.]|jgi:outer membrane protein OmpA-like peptidoglycan-associated protein